MCFLLVEFRVLPGHAAAPRQEDQEEDGILQDPQSAAQLPHLLHPPLGLHLRQLQARSRPQSEEADKDAPSSPRRAVLLKVIS